MKFANFLPPKGTIGFVSPSFGCATSPYREAFANALEKWGAMGYSCKIGPNCYACDGVGISSTPQNCAAELMKFYLDPACDCLLSCGGGELMCEILEYLDFPALAAAKPKWYMGYSDNTHFTHLLATLCDTASVYGPCAPAFGMEPWHPSLQDAFDLLCGRKNRVEGYPLWEKESLKNEENPLVPYHVTEPRILTKVPDCDLSFSGRLLGGCMDCLINMAGTRFDKTAAFAEKYREDGIVWFLEACDLNVFSIRRAMWQLEQAGWFSHVSGFLIGRPLNGQEMMGLDARHAVLEVALRHNVPVVMDVDLGHLPPMMPLIVGSLARVLCVGNQISIEMKLQP